MNKLASPLKYVHVAEVNFGFNFPIDMLRYDGCFPASEEDSGIIRRAVVEHAQCNGRIACVKKYSEHKSWMDAWTFARWRSFDAELRPVE